MFLEKEGNSEMHINLDLVMFVCWDKKKRIRFHKINGDLLTWVYPSKQKAWEDMQVIKRID